MGQSVSGGVFGKQKIVRERADVAAKAKAKGKAAKSKGKGTGYDPPRLKLGGLTTVEQKYAKKFMPCNSYLWRVDSSMRWCARRPPFSPDQRSWRCVGASGDSLGDLRGLVAVVLAERRCLGRRADLGAHL